MARRGRSATRKGTKRRNARSSGRGSTARRDGLAVPRNLVSLGSIVPDRIMVTMPYGEMIQRSPGATTDNYQFNLNSTFDPDSTGVGHQPLGRDQLAGVLYNRYRVHSVRFTVEFGCIGASGIPCLHYLQFVNGAATPSTITDVLEQPWSIARLQRDPNNGFKCELKLSANLWDIWGKSRAEYLADDTTGAVYSTSPVEVFIGNIGIGTADRTTSITAWQFAVKIQYVVEWYDRVYIAAS